MKYKVLKEFNLNGIIQKENEIIELDYVKANLKSIKDCIEKAPENTAASDGSVIGSIKPGEVLTAEQKMKLAAENAKETAEAHRLAAEQRTQDIKDGRGEPAVKVVADALKEKLTSEQFQKNETPTPPAPTV